MSQKRINGIGFRFAQGKQIVGDSNADKMDCHALPTASLAMTGGVSCVESRNDGVGAIPSTNRLAMTDFLDCFVAFAIAHTPRNDEI